MQTTRDDAARASEVDSRLLAASGLFDAEGYRNAAALAADADAASHYLQHGWQAGIEPSAHFEGRFLLPYYRSAGFEGAPAITFLMLQAAGWPVYATWAHAHHFAAIIAASPLFDAHAYAARAGGLAGLDPALHYVLVGEQMGLSPGPGFDPEYYGGRYPDVPIANVNRFAHFVADGQREGRRGTSVTDTLHFEQARLHANRGTVLLFVHEASRTGAPVLAYNIAKRLGDTYDVVAVLLGDGELFGEFETCCAAAIGPIARTEWHDSEARRLVQRLCASYRVRYAIANSIETRWVLPSLARAHVPVVTLVHEFASYTKPRGSMGQALDWSTQVVFSADVVAASAQAEHPTISGRPIHVLPQGPCAVPPSRETKPVSRSRDELAALARQKAADEALIVLGCGSVHLRKGVDLFLACASAVARLAPSRPVRFVWIGGGYRPEEDVNYSSYLADQVQRAGLTRSVTILDPVEDLEPAYALADIFFLSSRLDPLPNVAIDAAFRGRPVICFEEATGIADLFAVDPLARRCVVPYLDVGAAAAVIARLADDEGERRAIGDATERLADTTFDTDRYVRRLDELGIEAARIMRQRIEDFATLQADPLFDAGVYVHPRQRMVPRDEAIDGFLARWLAVGTSPRSASNGLFRRPCAGFHPQIYAHAHRETCDTASVNPLAHYVRAGRPEGPWSHDVISPFTNGDTAERTTLRVALHGHFFYPELVRDLLEKLAANRSRCDLWLTTDEAGKADALTRAVRGYVKGKVVIRLVPNRGRDIGPLVTGLAAELLPRYDVIGHLHSKRSVGVDDGIGESWREFLWQHLVGDTHPMMDLVLGRFVSDPALGMVFPDDPYLSDWDDNLEIAHGLAARMGIATLPPFFDFPNGTMFWARSAALKPLCDLALDWNEYPDEPVPRDGTVLHAIERLLPFAASRAGYGYATTHVPGVTR